MKHFIENLQLSTMRYSILSSSTKSAKGFGIKMLLLILYISMAGIIQAQTVTRTECGCLNNQTQLGNGQFQETISFNTTTGQSWVVESSVGLFLTSSPAPPADPVPLPANYPVTESPAGSGTYVLSAKRLDNTTYSLILYNGTTRLNVNSLQTCTYPRRDIFGDFGACIDAANKTYFIDIPTSRLVTSNWGLSGGGSFLGSSVNTRTVTVDWGNAVGNYFLSVSGTARAYPGQTSGFCNFSDQDTVAIVDEEPVPLACNNLVHLSMNGRCELMVLPDMVLEAPVYDESSYNIVLRDIQRDTIIPNRRISMDYLNKLIEVKVVHECSQNACWGLLKLEDKNIPRLECQDTVTIQCDQLTEPTTNGILRFPLRANTVVTKIGARKYSVRNFDYCSDVILQYEDVASPLSDCDADYSSIITRTWFATDISGNTASCEQVIYIEKANASDIVFPGNYDDVLGPNPSLGACATDWIRLPNGHPSPETTGRPTGVFCLNVTVDYQDTKIAKCDGEKTFKLLRRWIISDLCTGQQIIRNQTISVMDNEAPIVIAPNEFTVGTQGLTCTSIINVPPPIVAFECSKYDYYVTYKVPDASGQPNLNASTDGVIRNPDKTYTITKVPEGVIRLWICYIVVDACQNVTEACTEVDIVDSTPPVPVCDNYSFAGLNSDGIAYVTSGSLDDGSWDNCGIDTLEISRMDIISWGPGIKFTCADAGKSFMVQLRATDLAGNSNTCMVEVRVQDNTPPTLTNCPNDITIDCNADILNLTQYGFPSAVDLCGATVTEEVKNNFIDGCGRGFITRVFTAKDASGNTATCDQIITVEPKNPFKRTTITWPQDHTFTNGCAATGIEPQNMPSGKKFPTWNPNPYPCAQIAYDYKDLVFQYVEGFCFKVLRTWTVIDWCQYNPITGAGIWTHTQVIKGQNTTPPTITKGCNTADIKVTQVDNCKSLIEATAEGTDDCTPADKLLWNYSIDSNNDGIAEATGNTNSFTRTVDFGNIAIKWTATDECGNTKTCTANVSVKDQKKPTPYCLSEITTVVMAETGAVTIWASDFDHGSFDNCSPQNKLKFSFSSNTTETGKTFRCADLTANITNFELSMFVTDEAGNSDFCKVSINVQDNGNCPNLTDPDPDNGNGNNNQNRIAITGNIGMEIPEMLEDAIVKITSEQGEFPRYVTTNDKGEFSFEDLAMNNDYSIQPSKNSDHLNGVSTLDLVLIQRHILNIKRLDTPFKIIAADANNDHKISATDLVNLRKLILGVIDKLPNAESWKFVDKNQVFPDPQIPFPYQQVLEYSAVENNVSNANFIAVKTGDVNGSYQSNFRTTAAENRSRNKIEYSINKINNNGIIELPIELNDVSNIKGLQLNLVFDATKYDLLDIKSGNAIINDKDYFLKDDNNIVISWINSDYDKSISGNLFTLVLQAKSMDNTQDILHLSEDNIHNEMYYDNNGEVLASGLELELRGNNLEDTFQVFQNTPNPFKTSTIIGFVVPQDEEVTLKVYDYTGAVLKKTQKYCNKGYNSFELNTTDLNKTGILFYTIETKTHSANKKMFVIK